MSKFRLAIAIILLLALPATALGKSTTPAPAVIQLDQLAHGLVKVNYESPEHKDVKIRISKGNDVYTYDSTHFNQFPLQHGNGSYTILVLEQAKGNMYRLVDRKTAIVNVKEAEDVFLQSIQFIEWDEEMAVIEKAKQLTKGLKTEREKFKAIYEFIIHHIKYDQDKEKTVKPGYIPVIDTIYEDAKGICYDYASVMAAMLRSVGIPTKLAMGYTDEIKSYHAWNEVYFADTQKWETIDPTYDAAYAQANQKTTMFKKAANYKIEKIY